MSTCFRRLMIARWISFSLSRRFSTVKAQRYNAMPLTFIFFFFFFPWIWRYATCRISLSSLSTEISNIIGFFSLSEENNNLDLLLSKVFSHLSSCISVYISKRSIEQINMVGIYNRFIKYSLHLTTFYADSQSFD